MEERTSQATPGPVVQPGIEQWYFSVIVYDSDEPMIELQQTHGPFHTKYLAERMLTARVEQLMDAFKGPGLRSILVVPATQAVELALVEPIKAGDLMPGQLPL